MLVASRNFANDATFEIKVRVFHFVLLVFSQVLIQFHFQGVDTGSVKVGLLSFKYSRTKGSEKFSNSNLQFKGYRL